MFVLFKNADVFVVSYTCNTLFTIGGIKDIYIYIFIVNVLGINGNVIVLRLPLRCPSRLNAQKENTCKQYYSSDAALERRRLSLNFTIVCGI